jgi:hypothetical protein
MIAGVISFGVMAKIVGVAIAVVLGVIGLFAWVMNKYWGPRDGR